MESVLRSLNYDLQFDKDAQHILESSRHSSAIALQAPPLSAAAPGPLVPVATASTTTSDLLQKLGASIINSIQLQSAPLQLPAAASIPASETLQRKMEFGFNAPQIVLDSGSYGSQMEELQQQVEYDKFMNEVWIGIVLTLILISMVFCFCSCFLYHQFRVWKRNYRTTLTQNVEDDSVKITLDMEDPVPEYTLVSGLPSYEAALELLHKNPQSCLIVHPSVFEIFQQNEKSSATASNAETSEVLCSSEAAMPLLNESSAPKAAAQVIGSLPSYQEAITATPLMAGTPPHNATMVRNHSFIRLALTNEKMQSKSQIPEKTAAPQTPDSEKPPKS